MYLYLLMLLVLGAFGHYSPDLCVNTNVLKQHLVTAFSHKRSYLQQAAKDQTFKYIKNIFNDLATQTDAIAYEHPFVKIYRGKARPATNAILIVKGSRWGTDSDSISLMGAHYDSVEHGPGVCDNGASMATLLEVARAVTMSRCARLNSVIFVAFDWEEHYLSGSESFVYQQLIPGILKSSNIPANKFQGAYILDTVMNFDDEPRTQNFPREFGFLFPDSIKKVKAHDSAGDFLASIGRGDDRPLMELLQKHWNGSADGKGGKFRVVDFSIPFSGRPSDSSLGSRGELQDLYRSDHYHFWNYAGDYTNKGLKAVFLTDTAEFRGYMQTCYHQECDDKTHITRQRMQFLGAITNALTNSLLEMATEASQCKC